jgi:hypothetical protein
MISMALEIIVYVRNDSAVVFLGKNAAQKSLLMQAA